MNLNIFVIISYVLYVMDNVIREVLRSKNKAPRISRKIDDKYSSLLTVFYLFLVPLTSLFFITGIGNFNNSNIKMFGLFMQVVALIVRIVALQKLRQFYTGTLTILSDHHLEKDGIYRHIRHPGYLSVLLLSIGFGLAIGNIISIGIILSLYLAVYAYRIRTEERMLAKYFREEYIEYSKKTYRLIPYVW